MDREADAALAPQPLQRFLPGSPCPGCSRFLAAWRAFSLSCFLSSMATQLLPPVRLWCPRAGPEPLSRGVPSIIPGAGVCSQGQAGATEPGSITPSLGRSWEGAGGERGAPPISHLGILSSSPSPRAGHGARGSPGWFQLRGPRDRQRDRRDVHAVPAAAATLQHRLWLGGCTQRYPRGGGVPQHPWPGLPCGAPAHPQWGEGERGGGPHWAPLFPATGECTAQLRAVLPPTKTDFHS